MSRQKEYIDSDYRISGTSANFMIELQPNSAYDSVCVLSANIPKSFYLIQNGNNTVVIVENSTPRTITVPPGNYSVSDFLGQLVVLMNPGRITFTEALDKPTQITTYTAIGGSAPTIQYTISISKYTSKITYMATGGTFNSIILPHQSSLYRQLGFNYDSTNIVAANTITSVNLPLFQLTNLVFIRSDIHQNPTSNLGGNILQSITCTNNPNMSSITYQISTDPHQIAEVNQKKQVANFYITDADGFTLDLGGLPVNIELLFFNRDNSAEIMRRTALVDNMEKLASRHSL